MSDCIGFGNTGYRAPYQMNLPIVIVDRGNIAIRSDGAY